MKKLLVVLVLFLGLVGCGGNKEENPSEELGEIHVFDEKKDGDLLRNLTFEIDGNKLEYPFTIKEVMDAGMTYVEEGQDPIDKLIDVNTGNFHSAQFKYEDETNFVYGINVSEEPIALEDCLVKEIIIRNKGVSAAGITIGEDTYDTVIRKIGKTEKRGDSVEEDIEKNGILKGMMLSATYEDEFIVGKTKIERIIVSFDFDSKGVVNQIHARIQNINVK